MGLVKHDLPILEYDTEQTAVIMPNRNQLFTLPEKCVYAFLGETFIDEYAKTHQAKKVAEFESITKLYPIYATTCSGQEICFCHAPLGAAAAVQILDFLISYGVKQIISCGSYLYV